MKYEQFIKLVESEIPNALNNKYAFDKSDIEKRIGFLNSANLMYAFYDDLNESAIILANEIASTLIKSGYIP